jgi:hypothetical protein
LQTTGGPADRGRRPGSRRISVQTSGEIVFLYEVETTFRQIFTDGRKQLTDPSPSWMGYSVGEWEADTLVVDTVGSMIAVGWTPASTGIARRCASKSVSIAAISAIWKSW